MVSVEQHFWLTLTDIKEKDKTVPCLRLFGEYVTGVVEKFQAVKQQSAVFRQLIPRRSREAELQLASACSHSSCL